MKFDFTSERVLAVVAHPDDAELLCAGTLARARDNGASIGICVLCQGEKGQPSTPIDHLADVRREEMRQAAGLLQAELFFGELPDGTLADCSAQRQLLLKIFRGFRPSLVLAHAPNDYHPDHQGASKLTQSVSWFAASRGHETSESPLAAPPAVWCMDTVGMHDFTPTLFINVSAYVELKERMLDCHRSQITRAGDRDFAPLRELMRQQLQTRGLQSQVDAAEAFVPLNRFKRMRAW